MIILDDWQQEIEDYRGDMLSCTGRRVGKTYIYSRKAVKRMVEDQKHIIVVSLTEDQAMLIVSMALNYAMETYPKLIGKGKYKPTMKTLTLIVNRKPIKMISRPVGTTGNSVRGFGGGILIVDEAARMPHMFWIAAKPIILTEIGEIWMCSTPFGKGTKNKPNYFWKRFNEAYVLKDPKARFKAFYVTTPEVIEKRPISESWTKEQRKGALRVLEEDKREMSELEFAQEYLGKFVEELRQFFPDGLIDSCMTLQRRSSSFPSYNDKFLGVDVAQMGEDESVLFSVNRREGETPEINLGPLGIIPSKKCKIIEQIDMEITRKTRLTDTIDRIKISDERWNFKKIFIDDGGMGVGVFDPLLADEQTKRKVIAINNARRSLNVDDEHPERRKLMKEDLYNNLLHLMERGKVKLFDEEKIRLSLKSVQAEYINGKLRIFGRYTHIAEALIRAAWCMKDKTLNTWVVFV